MTLSLSESQAPAGYSASTAAFTVKIAADAKIALTGGKFVTTTTYTITIDGADAKDVTNEKDTGTAFVHDAVTITKVDEDGAELAGAEFTLTDADGNEVMTYTGSEFEISTEELTGVLPEAGAAVTLTLAETKAPNGYDLAAAEYTVEISAAAEEALDETENKYITTTTYTITVDGGDDLEVVNTQKTGIKTIHDGTGKFIVNKVDSEDASVLAGAQFELSDEYGNVVLNLTSDGNGVVTVSTADLVPADYEPVDGDAFTYTLKETKAPAGYKLPEYEQEVTVGVSVEGPAYDADEDAFITTVTYSFDGDTEITVENEKEAAPIPPAVKHYILHYVTGGGTEYPDEEYPEGQIVNIDKVPVKPNYTFVGWYSDPQCTKPVSQVVMDRNRTVYAKWEKTGVPGELNGDDHYAYIIGYPDGLVHPERNITRAEVATIFFRLLTDEARDANLTSSNSFGDVSYGQWFNTAVSTMAKMGIVTGYPDGNFHPNANITRAEFAAIAARFDKEATAGGAYFSDIAGHWAQLDIERAARKGWITGYPDGTFGPERLATRAEVAALINRVLVRDPKEPEDLLENMIKWPDNMDENAWFYMDIQEATNTHIYERVTKVTEVWTEMEKNPDWTKYNY